MIGIGWLLFDFLFFFETQYNIIFTRYHRNNEHESRVIRVHSCKRTKKKKKKWKIGYYINRLFCIARPRADGAGA
jgi:hypothetical protein